MYIGGYKIIDFLNKVIDTTCVTIARIYDKLKAAFGTPKAIMVTGVNVENVSTPTGRYECGHPSVAESRIIDKFGDEFRFPVVYIGDLENEDFSSAHCEPLQELEARYAGGINGDCEYNGALPQITVSEGGSASHPSSVRAVQLLTYSSINDGSNKVLMATFLYFNEYTNKHILIKASTYMDGGRLSSNITIIHTFDY